MEPKGPTFQADGHFQRPVVDWPPLAHHALENQELGQQLRAAVDRLPQKYRLVLMLSDYEHRSMREIAEDLELTIPAVKTRLHRARLALREELAAYLDGRI